MLYANLLLNVLYHIEIEMKIRESCLQTGNFIYKPGISLTKQDFHLQRGSLGLQRGFSGYYLPVASNANMEITTSYGIFTVAGAIALRSRLRGAGAYGVDADFEGRLQKKLSSEYNERVQFCDRKNSQLQSTAEEMRLSILGKESKTKDEKPLGVVEAYVKENTTELVDPLDVKKKMEALEEKRNTLLTELDI